MKRKILVCVCPLAVCFLQRKPRPAGCHKQGRESRKTTSPTAPSFQTPLGARCHTAWPSANPKNPPNWRSGRDSLHAEAPGVAPPPARPHRARAPPAAAGAARTGRAGKGNGNGAGNGTKRTPNSEGSLREARGGRLVAPVVVACILLPLRPRC